MSSIEEKVIEIVDEHLQIAPVLLDSKLELVPGRSEAALETMALLMQLEDEFKIDILDEEISRLKTVSDIVALVKAKGYLTEEEIEAARIEAERQRTERIADIKRTAKAVMEDSLGRTRGSLTSDTPIKDLGVATDRYELLMSLEETLEIQIDEDEASKARTVGDLIKLIIQTKET